MLPNGLRLSCAAKGCRSQLQFYYEGRRQLQPHVRLHSVHVGKRVACHTTNCHSLPERSYTAT